MKKLLLLGLLFPLLSCDPAKDERHLQLQASTEQASTPSRFNIQRESVFHDTLAYDRWRGVYIITDTKTGKEYIGVSGIGISEIGSHYCGKGCTQEDER